MARRRGTWSWTWISPRSRTVWAAASAPVVAIPPDAKSSSCAPPGPGPGRPTSAPLWVSVGSAARNRARLGEETGSPLLVSIAEPAQRQAVREPALAPLAPRQHLCALVKSNSPRLLPGAQPAPEALPALEVAPPEGGAAEATVSSAPALARSAGRAAGRPAPARPPRLANSAEATRAMLRPRPPAAASARASDPRDLRRPGFRLKGKRKALLSPEAALGRACADCWQPWAMRCARSQPGSCSLSPVSEGCASASLTCSRYRRQPPSPAARGARHLGLAQTEPRYRCRCRRQRPGLAVDR